jgi:RNA polymerase sigma factor (sigma-70 family)
MQIMDEIELLHRSDSEVFEDAFAALVRRYVNLVYSSALRQVRDPSLAEEVAQTVFVLLARKARSLRKGTVLSGWLYRATRFVASEALRSENRRRRREQEAMKPLAEEIDRSPWEEIEPLLDEAMARLGEADRSLVLMRYFEDKSLKDLGDALGITENAAQKRVARAVEQLRGFFVQRGSGISTAGLAAVLSAFAVQAAPAGLTASILTTAASATAVTSSALTLAILKYMALTKIKTAAVAVVILAALTVPVVWQQRTVRQLREENETLRTQLQQRNGGVRKEAALPSADTAELERLRREAAEVHRLRGEIGPLRQELANLKKGATSPKDAASANDPAQTDTTTRMRLARELKAQGKNAEALEHLLWCFDEGLKHNPSFTGVRLSFLLNDMAELGKQFPPAREALANRRDATESRLASGTADPMTVLELVRLNEHLGEPDKNMAFFDRLPPEHPGRGSLVDGAMEQFVTAKRYQDVVNSGHPEAVFDREQFGFSQSAKVRAGNESLNAASRRRVVESGGRGVEALSGAGQIDRAKALADKVLTIDASPETRGELLKHAERAGNAEVVAHIKSK